MKKNILLIDDDDTICEIIDMLLKAEGYDLKILNHGNNLESSLELFKPDLFIIDYLMPGRNGAEIARYVRSRQDIKNTPIIMIAANQKYKTESMKAGVNIFLNKPFDIYELLQIVSTYTQKGKS
jgi:DNA-binding response OmpR family regulator